MSFPVEYISFLIFGSRPHYICLCELSKHFFFFFFSAAYGTSSAFKECLSQTMQTTGTKQIQQDNCNQAASADSVVWDFRAH